MVAPRTSRPSTSSRRTTRLDSVRTSPDEDAVPRRRDRAPGRDLRAAQSTRSVVDALAVSADQAPRGRVARRAGLQPRLTHELTYTARVTFFRRMFSADYRAAVAAE